MHEFYEKSEYPTAGKKLNIAEQKFNYKGNLTSIKKKNVKK